MQIAAALSAVNRNTIGSTRPPRSSDNRGETVTGVSQRLLAQYGGLRGWLRLDAARLGLR
jgi:hypothetical protein